MNVNVTRIRAIEIDAAVKVPHHLIEICSDPLEERLPFSATGARVQAPPHPVSLDDDVKTRVELVHPLSLIAQQKEPISERPAGQDV